MINYKILIDNVDYTNNCTLPFKEQYVLDSALDNGILSIPMITRKEIFKPFTKVQITKDDDTYTMLVASDKVTEIVASGKYTHDLILIEETKLLEKKIVDTNTTTQPLVHNYITEDNLGVFVVSTYTTTPLSQDYYYNNLFTSIVKKAETIIMPSVKAWFDNSTSKYKPSFVNIFTYFWGLKVTSSSGVIVYNFSENGYPTSSVATQTHTLSNLPLGEYTVKYSITGRDAGDVHTSDTFTFSVIPETPTRQDKSITDVVNRLLAITETLRVDESPSLVFNNEQAQIYGQRYSIIKDIPTLIELEANFEFITNNENYDTIIIDDTTILFTRTYEGVTINTFAYIDNHWTNENYKKLLYSTKLPTNIATWLVDNTIVNGIPIYPAPEFAMTKSTLRECLDQIGSYIHSIVRLNGNVISFDKLGGTTETTLNENYIGNYETLDGEQYATQLDSIVSNLVNIDNEQQGTIIEPLRDAYKTVRAESGTIRINDTSAIITTDYPIEKIHKLYCGYIKIDGKDVLVGDITPYVYESAEYKLLSSTGGVFPNSKGFAITYTQGQKDITGLTFKLPDPISPIFENQAILNIISQKIGQPIQTLFKVQNITELNFQLIYYPSTTARVKQSKSNITDYDKELTSIFNQSANKVDSRAYGENLKGTIARLGNIEKFITFTTKNVNDLVEVGNYVIIDNEDYYIATLDVENQIDHIKYTAGLSKDFNALSKYIGIKNNIRLYEVSEKQSVERYVTYDDYCVIGNPITSDSKQLLTPSAIMNTARQFSGFVGGNYSVSIARLRGYDIDNNPLEQVDLPVFSLALGNSIWLGCKYEDNYNAGNTSALGTNQTGESYYRIQDYVKYTDNWGEIETLDVKLYDYLDLVNTLEKAIEVGNALPKSTLRAIKSPILSTANNNLIIKKDSREQINLSYQLYFVTNNGIIIGSQLSQGNAIVTNTVDTPTSASLYILPTRINKFATKIDLTNATLIRNYNQDNTHITFNSQVESEIRQVIFANETATTNGKSWVLVDNASGNLLFGKNITIENGGTIEMPTMTFTHKVI